MADLVLIPRISIHPDRICFFNEVNWLGARKCSYDPETGEEIKKIKYDHLLRSARSAEGHVSEIAKRKMNKALEYLLLMSSEKKVTSRTTGRTFAFKIAFITLTLPSAQIHPDKQIKSECLNQFIVEIKKYYHVLNYIWRAEKQKNGSLHFHIVVDKFIPWYELRDRWNRIVNKLGYVDRYRAEMKQFHQGGFKVRQDLIKKWDYKSQIKAYKTGIANDWNSPNSTDIHSIRRILNLKNYISKYLTKPAGLDHETGELLDELTKVTGRIWGCNQPLGHITGGQIILDSSTEKQLKKAIETSECRVYDADYFSVFFINYKQLPKIGANDIYIEFCRYLQDHFGYSDQLYMSS